MLAAGRTRGEHVRARQQAFYAAAAAALSGDAGPAGAARLWQAANDERNRSYFAELRTGGNAGERDEADVAAGGYESVASALAFALGGGPAARLILNVRNGGTVPALPPDMVIEVPCRVDADGAVPLPVSAPSAHQLGLMSVVRASERDIADARLSLRAVRLAWARPRTRASAPAAWRCARSRRIPWSARWTPRGRSPPSRCPRSCSPQPPILHSYPTDIVIFSCDQALVALTGDRVLAESVVPARGPKCA